MRRTGVDTAHVGGIVEVAAGVDAAGAARLRSRVARGVCLERLVEAIRLNLVVACTRTHKAVCELQMRISSLGMLG